MYVYIREFWDLFYFTSLMQYRYSKSHVLLTGVCDLTLCGGNLHFISFVSAALFCVHMVKVFITWNTLTEMSTIFEWSRFLSKIIYPMVCCFFYCSMMQVAGNWSFVRNGAVYQLTSHSYCAWVLYTCCMDVQEVPVLCKGVHIFFIW
jgi:hypothetical protein